MLFRFKICKLLALIVVLLNLVSCANLFSGSEPVPTNFENRETLKKVIKLLNPPDITTKVNNKNVKIYIASFDGTQNDGNNVSGSNERDTVVHFIHKQLEANGYEDGEYYPGPGTQWWPLSTIDSAVCVSCLGKADDAMVDFSKQLDEWRHIPNLEVRVLVIGFSRGAAIGRHFMNLINEEFPTSLSNNLKYPDQLLVRTYGLLYDTVATSIVGEVNLQISPSTDFVIHLVSKDEKRRLFPITKDEDKSFKTKTTEYLELSMKTCPAHYLNKSKRLIQIEVPGVHSDVGASYLNGIGSFYRIYSELILRKMGLIQKKDFVMVENLFMQGQHDSNGLYDDVLNLFKGEPKRGSEQITANPLSKLEMHLLSDRVKKMKLITPSHSLTHNEVVPLVLDVVKIGNTLEIKREWTGLEYHAHVYDNATNSHQIVFRSIQATRDSILHIPQVVWDSLKSAELSRLEFVPFGKNKFSSGHFYVDCKHIFKMDETSEI